MISVEQEINGKKYRITQNQKGEIEIAEVKTTFSPIDAYLRDGTPEKNEALLPCPFCGEAPTVTIRLGKDGWRDRYAVLCDYENGGCGAESGWYHSRVEAVEAWNRRIKA